MPTDPTIELERGLCCFYELQREFERRELPEEKRCAFCWEAGYQAGKAEALSAAALEMLRKNAAAKPPHWMERQQIEEHGREIPIMSGKAIGREWA